MEIRMDGRTALVTGGGVGIGRAVALALARCGADVALTYLSHAEAAEEAVAAIRSAGARGFALALDATDPGQVKEIVRQAAGLLGGRIDILVNNAGSLVRRLPFAEISEEHWHRVLAVNLDSAFYVTQAVLPFMSGDWGRIINVSSLAGRNGGGKGAVAYGAAKAAMLGLTRGLAKELAPAGITVNALAPGLILGTPFHENFTPADTLAGQMASIPVGRAGTPDEVAGAVVYLASDLGGFVTGETVEINGGAWFV